MISRSQQKRKQAQRKTRAKYAVWLFDMELVNLLKAHAERIGRSVTATASVILNVALTPGYVHPDGKSRNATEEEVAASLKRVLKKRGKTLTYDRIEPEEVAKALGAEPAGEQPPRRPGRQVRAVFPYGSDVPEGVGVLCRRSGCCHGQSIHTRGDQRGCSIMGCNCARFM